MNRFQYAFGLLILAQAAHSVEEYVGRLWESFPPARLLTGLFSENRERAFLALNVALVAFGFWCFIWPVRRGWPSAALFAWIWVAIELINGIVHPLWALSVRGYAPEWRRRPCFSSSRYGFRERAVSLRSLQQVSGQSFVRNDGFVQLLEPHMLFVGVRDEERAGAEQQRRPPTIQ